MIHKIGGVSLCILIMFLLPLPQEECALGPTILVWRNRVQRICNVWVMRPAGDHFSASVHQGNSESAQVQSGMNRTELRLLLHSEFSLSKCLWRDPSGRHVYVYTTLTFRMEHDQCSLSYLIGACHSQSMLQRHEHRTPYVKWRPSHGSTVTSHGWWECEVMEDWVLIYGQSKHPTPKSQKAAWICSQKGK